MKKRSYLIIIVSIILIIGISLFIFLHLNKEKKINYEEYLATFKDEDVVSSISFNNINSIIIKENDKYNCHLFDNNKGIEITLNDIIKKDKEDEFKEKINELIYKKYPKFISDVLINNENNVYAFYSDKLVIYFYDYEINPLPSEELFLNVSYSNISSFLNIEIPTRKQEDEDGFKIDSNKKHVAITFDDGPGKYTSDLATFLYDNKVHATFFMVGRSLNTYSDAVKTVDNLGHEIGYHSFDHTNFKRQSLSKITEEFNNSNSILQNIIGKDFKLTRPPYGSVNASIKSTLPTPFILWSIDTNDWRYRDVDYLYNYTLDNIYDGAIILFHDIHPTSVEAIKKIVPELYVRGYQLVTVSTLANINEDALEPHQTYSKIKVK